MLKKGKKLVALGVLATAIGAYVESSPYGGNLRRAPLIGAAVLTGVYVVRWAIYTLEDGADAVPEREAA